MGFSSKRGRPKLEREAIDYGTEQLQKKREQNMTTEALDLCLKRSLIDIDEHEAGLRLRWLYTLRYGSPGIRAYHPDNFGVSCFRVDDEEWLQARKIEYENAVNELNRVGAKRIVMHICVFNKRALFLLPYKKIITSHEGIIRHNQYLKFKEGLALLSVRMGKKSAKVTPIR